MFRLHLGLHDPYGLESLQTDDIDLQAKGRNVLAVSVHDLVGTHRLSGMGDISMAVSSR